MELSPADDGEGPSEPSKRRSGRVIKKPDFIIASSPTGGAKRKRPVQDDDDEEGAQGDSGDESEETEGEPDEEELRERKRTAQKVQRQQSKPAQKKAKTDGAATSLPIRPATSKPKRSRKAHPVNDAGAGEVGGLYAEVFAQDHTFDSVAANWISRFDEHQAGALADIVNFVLKCAGCDIQVNGHDIDDPDSCTTKLTDIQDEYQSTDIVDYPLIAKKTAHNFKQSLTGFFDALLLTTAKADLLYNNVVLMENIEVWISTMSSAANRPFRHTATVVSLAIVSSLCTLAKKLVQNEANFLRQRDKEAGKAKPNKARVKAFDEKAAQEERKRGILDGFIRDWFDTVFVHRYRDIDSKIRVDCVQALSSWIITYPDLFFDGNHLRYLGWVLSDVAAPTRHEVVKQLQKLYRDKDKIAGLKTFTERFRPRMVEIATQDAEVSVRVDAVKLIELLRGAGLLETDDIDMISKLIFDAEPRVRNAVSAFFAESVNDLYRLKVEEMGGDEILNEALVPYEGDEDYDSPRMEWITLKSLVEILESYDDGDDDLRGQVGRGPTSSSLTILPTGMESRPSVAAQAIYEKVPEVKEWEILAGYLLFDHSQITEDGTTDDPEELLKQGCRLSGKEEVILLEVLNAAVRVRLTQAAEAGKQAKKTKAQKQEQLEQQETAARHLAQIIPKLLNKFGSTPETASAVLRLEHVLNLDIFQELRQDSTTFSLLLDDIKNQFLTHANQNVLGEASAALLHAKSFEELGEITEGKLQVLWDDTTSHFCTITKGRDLRTRGNLSANILTDLSNTVLRISNLAPISDCAKALEATASSCKSTAPTSSSTVRSLIDIIRRGIPAPDMEPQTDNLEDVLVTSACRSATFYMMWKVQSWRNVLSSGSPVPDEELDHIAETRDAFVSSLAAVIRSRQGADELRLAVTGTYLDLYVLFATLRQAKKSAVTGTSVQKKVGEDPSDDYLALVLPVPREMEGVLLQVLGAVEKAFARVSRKKLEPADVDDEPVDEDEVDLDSEEEGQSEEEEQEGGEEDEERRLEKQRAVLLWEQRLCELAGRIVLAIIAGVVDVEHQDQDRMDDVEGDAVGATRNEYEATMRKRLERNKAKLGHSYKAVLDHLDAVQAVKRGKAKGKAKAEPKRKPEVKVNGQAKRRARGRKNTDVLADEGEDADDNEDGEVTLPEEGTEEDLRARELVVGEVNAEHEGLEDIRTEMDEEGESVLGD